MAAGGAPQPSLSQEFSVKDTTQAKNRENAQTDSVLLQSMEQIIHAGATVVLPELPSSFADALKGKTASKDSIPAQLTSSDFVYKDLKRPAFIKGIPTVLFNVTEQHTLVSKFQFALIGKFSHGKPSWNKVIEFFNRLKLKSSYNVSIFDHKHLYIVCSDKVDFYRLWLRLVWYIDGFAMRMFKWEPQFSALKESSIAPVWIRMENLPLYMFDQMPLLNLSNAIGKPICIDPRNLNGSMLNSARVCVELDVSKPLIDVIKIGIVHNDSNTLMEEVSVKIFYDVVPPFCHSCWHVGHCQAKCKRSAVHSEVVESHNGPIQRPGKEMAENHLTGPSSSSQSGVKTGGVCSQVWKVKGKKKAVHSITCANVAPGQGNESVLVQTSSTHSYAQSAMAVQNRFSSLMVQDSAALASLEQATDKVDQSKSAKEWTAVIRGHDKQIRETKIQAANEEIAALKSGNETELAQQIITVSDHLSGKSGHEEKAVNDMQVVVLDTKVMAIPLSPTTIVINQQHDSEGKRKWADQAEEQVVGSNKAIVVHQAHEIEQFEDTANNDDHSKPTDPPDTELQMGHDIEADPITPLASQFTTTEHMQAPVETKNHKRSTDLQHNTHKIATDGDADVDYKNNKTIGVVTRSQMKASNNTWANHVEEEQTAELHTPIATKKQEEYKARHSNKTRRKEIIKLSNRINKIASRLKDKNMRDETKRQLQTELETLKFEHSRLC